MRPFVIPTGAMEDTLLVGDHLLVNTLTDKPDRAARLLLPRTGISRGDLVVIRPPSNPSQYFVKRVVGVPGDRIRITRKTLHVDDRPMSEPYKSNKTDYFDSYRDNFPSEPQLKIFDSALAMLAHHVRNGEVVVPTGHYFVMGDNRDSSLDSRYFGLVSRDGIQGRPWLIYWSQEPGGQTRWSRVVKPLRKQGPSAE